MNKWIITGIIATVLIVLSIPLQVVKFYILSSEDQHTGSQRPRFTGGASCIECHQVEFELWKGSHHDMAMDPATDETVLGDFNNAEYEHDGTISLFYRKDSAFYVRTPGPDGIMGDFEVKYTFGYEPLQQYLVPFEGGKLQCLPIAWDTEGKRWYHLFPEVYPGQDIPPDDWLYWTNPGQNWNLMCADCHSTNLVKGLDPETMTYETTWSDIDVNCEACHGPGSAHIEWANLPELDRPLDNNAALVVRTRDLDTRTYVNLCAPCHSRRVTLKDMDHFEAELMDIYIPELVDEPFYFNDGQILEEDYVYGSFLQSKMYMNDVKCNDCHDAHSLELVAEGNLLCAQCHKQEQYDTYSHHFHKEKGEEGEPLVFAEGDTLEVGSGAECINCHMTARYYMGVDLRNDHSFRIPRPDLTKEIGTPNACNGCHKDKSTDWSLQYMEKWYGIKKRPHYGYAIDAGNRLEPQALPELIRISTDDLYPDIVRATAISLISGYGDTTALKIVNELTADPDPLVRYYAIRNLYVPDPLDLVSTVVPLLYDPVRSVRIEAGITLSALPRQMIDTTHHKLLKDAIAEYERAMLHTADFAASRHNLGNLYANLGKSEEAIKQYLEALKIDDKFYPAAVNLAILYNSVGQNAEAEKMFRAALETEPDLNEVYYYMGLLMAETGRYEEAAEWLERAVARMPERHRAYYNLGQIYDFLGEPEKAETALWEAFEKDPGNTTYQIALLQLYRKHGDSKKEAAFLELID